MKTYALLSPRFLSPQWFNASRYGRHDSIVAQDGTVSVFGETLAFETESLPPGTLVRVWLNSRGFFVCATMADIEKQEKQDLEKAYTETEKRRRHLNDLRAEAEAFNARIGLPVRWDVGIKDVLSGLSPNSWGDGRNRATVEHVYLLEPLVEGRLKREKGDFLCSASSRSNGKRWSTVVDRAYDGDGNLYQPKITCKACLRLVKKWMKD